MENSLPCMYMAVLAVVGVLFQLLAKPIADSLLAEISVLFIILNENKKCLRCTKLDIDHIWLGHIHAGTHKYTHSLECMHLCTLT